MAVSGLKSDPCVFCRRLKTCRPAADEAPRHTGEKISGTQGRRSTTLLFKLSEVFVAVAVDVALAFS